MFQNATEVATGFTNHVVISTRRRDGSVTTEIAAFVILNEAGWVMTSAHILTRLQEFERDLQAAADWQAGVDEIKDDQSLTGARKQTLLKKVRRPDPKWITQCSYSWGTTDARPALFHLDPVADLALIELENYPVAAVKDFPVFGNPARRLRRGASVCRLGYPFSVITSSWDEQREAFMLTPGALPMPLFPLDGIHTRTVLYEDAASGRKAAYFETSTPGLAGQSGGPIYDIDGTVWAIQSRTISLELGFRPTVVVDGKSTTEHQFLNVGHGSDITEIVRFAAECGVSITVKE